jgi:hypothetical protein
MLLGEPMRRFHEDLRHFAGQNPALKYYYVTAREMARRVHQIENGQAIWVKGDDACAAQSRPTISDL